MTRVVRFDSFHRLRGVSDILWMDEMWHSRQAEVFKWCTGKHGGSSALLISRGDGTFTGNAKEIDQLLHDAWMPIFSIFAKVEEPSWAAFEERYSKFTKSVPMECNALTEEMLMQTMRRLT